MSKHYMQKNDGEIIAIPANEWARYRADGYKFSTKADYDAQVSAKAGPGADDSNGEVPTMDNTKAEILDYAEANDIAVDSNNTKAELLDAISG